MSIYIKENIVELRGKKYERLYNHPYNYKWRIIFHSEDYDYIEDENLIKELNELV